MTIFWCQFSREVNYVCVWSVCVWLDLALHPEVYISFFRFTNNMKKTYSCFLIFVFIMTLNVHISMINGSTIIFLHFLWHGSCENVALTRLFIFNIKCWFYELTTFSRVLFWIEFEFFLFGYLFRFWIKYNISSKHIVLNALKI